MCVYRLYTFLHLGGYGLSVSVERDNVELVIMNMFERWSLIDAICHSGQDCWDYVGLRGWLSLRWEKVKVFWTILLNNIDKPSMLQ